MRVRTKEIISLEWSMADKCWNHWLSGRGRDSITDTVRHELTKLQTESEHRGFIIRKIKELRLPDDTPASNVGDHCSTHVVKIELPASEWGEAVRSIGNSIDTPSTDELLLALILMSESWKHLGDSEEEEEHLGFLEGVYATTMVTAIKVTQIQRLRLGRSEKIAVWVIATAAVVNVLLGVFKMFG